MITISKQDVPLYLQQSPLYANTFDEDDSDLTIDVPNECFKTSPIVKTNADLRALLTTIRFWLIPDFIETSTEVFSYILENRDSLRLMLPDFLDDFPMLSSLNVVIQPADHTTVLKNAVIVGYLGLIKYLHNIGTPLYTADFRNYTSLAARHGHLDCFIYGLEHGCDIQGDECCMAAMGGHIEVFKAAAEHGCSLTTRNFCEVANLLELVKYMHSLGVSWDETVTSAAIRSNSVECLKYLLQHGCPLSDNCAVDAVYHGSFECLKLLHENGAAMSAPVVVAAASKRQLQYLEYVIEHGGESSSDACNAAACHGYVENLKYLHEHGATLTTTVVNNVSLTARAAQQKNLRMLEYLHEAGCPWDATTTNEAVHSDSVECLQYAVERGCPFQVHSEMLDRSPRCKKFVENYTSNTTESHAHKCVIS